MMFYIMEEETNGVEYHGDVMNPSARHDHFVFNNDPDLPIQAPSSRGDLAALESRLETRSGELIQMGFQAIPSSLERYMHEIKADTNKVAHLQRRLAVSGHGPAPLERDLTDQVGEHQRHASAIDGSPSPSRGAIDQFRNLDLNLVRGPPTIRSPPTHGNPGLPAIGSVTAAMSRHPAGIPSIPQVTNVAAAISQWFKPNPTAGHTMPLKDWPAHWQRDMAAKSIWGKRKKLAMAYLEFCRERFPAVATLQAYQDDAAKLFMHEYGSQVTKAIKAIQAKEGTLGTRRQREGTIGSAISGGANGQ
jgi:hypothetical protein